MKPRARQMPVNRPCRRWRAGLGHRMHRADSLRRARASQAHSYAELYAIHEQKPAGDGEE